MPRAVLNEAAEDAKVLLSKATEDAKAVLRKAAEDANAVLRNDIKEIKAAEVARDASKDEKIIEAAEDAKVLLARVKRLEGIIPICSYCKKIRDHKDCWLQLEQYLSEHSDAVFSHGICPDCMKTCRRDIFA